jgi:hypothetical protein
VAYDDARANTRRRRRDALRAGPRATCQSGEDFLDLSLGAGDLLRLSPQLFSTITSHAMSWPRSADSAPSEKAGLRWHGHGCADCRPSRRIDDAADDQAGAAASRKAPVVEQAGDRPLRAAFDNPDAPGDFLHPARG